MKEILVATASMLLVTSAFALDKVKCTPEQITYYSSFNISYKTDTGTAIVYEVPAMIKCMELKYGFFLGAYKHGASRNADRNVERLLSIFEQAKESGSVLSVTHNTSANNVKMVVSVEK